MIGTFGVGLVAWTLLEYALHRFAFHELRLGSRMAEEHLRHHAEVSYFAPWSAKVGLAVPGLAALTAGGGPALGAGGAAGLAAGVVAGWLGYEWLHRRLHTHGPATAYGRWARRHHFHHHFRDPRANHGVTSPLWDHVFGTATRVERVVVPARQAHHLPWLLGPDGELAPGLSADFELGVRRGAAGGGRAPG